MKIKLNLDRQERLDVLTGAIESNAIQYWASDYGLPVVTRNKELDIIRIRITAEDQNGEKKTYIVTPASVQIGVDRICQDGFEIAEYIKNSIVNDDMDSIAYDCIIQAAIFGELVYS